MKKTEEENKAIQDRIGKVLNHIQNVQRNCYKLGIRLLQADQAELGQQLIANGQIHDNSKFKGIEFDHLIAGSPLMPEVAKHHAKTNPHHPEFWGSINDMPDVYLAEMVCDCAARSAEFGTSIHDWFNDKALVRYNYTILDLVHHKIQHFLTMLLEPAFV
jgi:hypothetical protein